MGKKIFSLVFILSLILLSSGCKSMQGKGGGDGPGGGGGGGKKPGANDAQAKREPEFIDRDNNGVDDRDEQQEQDGPAPFSQAAQNGLDGSAPSLSSGNQQPSVAEAGISGGSPAQPSVHADVGVQETPSGRPASKPEPEIKPAEEKKTEEVKPRASALSSSLPTAGLLVQQGINFFSGMFDGKKTKDKSKE